MKRFTFLSVIISLALVSSACSVHLGLSKLIGGGGASATKTVKATHTPPAGGTPATTANKTATSNAVTIANAKYRPKNLTVKVGTTVTWTNNDSAPQSVTSDAPGLFDSGLLQPGGVFTYTFSQAGTFPYHSTATKTTFGSVTVTP